jgi:predicted nucleotidyltransferase component of viral defense system
MSSKAMGFKAHVRNKAKEKNVSAQVLLQNYMFERFLERLSRSAYRDKFILKGGILIAAVVGLSKRSTMDLDTTLRNIPLSEENIHSSLREICAILIDDDVKFKVGAINPIRQDDIYGGYRAALTAMFDTIETALSIDISTGDVITPKPVKFSLCGIFDEEKQIELWAYNIETVMAEKVETILSRNVLSTRPRDFYDIYILTMTQNFDAVLLQKAIEATATHRGTIEGIADRAGLLRRIYESPDLRGMWAKYQRQFDYAADISYELVIEALEKLCL